MVEAARIRAHLLNDVIFHGWPKEWVDAQPRFENRRHYRNRQRLHNYQTALEIVPGFFSSALLYEPQNMNARMPAILNVNGHVGPLGKAVEYKQKRCITSPRAVFSHSISSGSAMVNYRLKRTNIRMPLTLTWQAQTV